MKNLLRFLILGSLIAAVPAAFAAERVKPAKPERVAFGQKIKLEDYLVPGKTVVFDFTSQFCGPCRQVAPHLDRLHEKRDDIVVVAIDINRPEVKGIDWDSPVAKQYGVNSVPRFRVYGPDGKLKAEGKDAQKLVFSWLDSS